MTSVKRLVKELDEKHIELIGKFVSDIRNGKLQGDVKIALATINFLEQFISETQNATAFELVSMLRAVGQRIYQGIPNVEVAVNMVRRVLRAVRDENRAQANQSGEVAGESLQRLVLAASSRRATLGPVGKDLREPIRDQIAELRAELESTVTMISSQARCHIDADEAVVSYGHCPLMDSFLTQAAKVHRFRLLVAGGKESHAMAARLSAAGVSVTVISNEAVFAVMSRVNKVVISVKTALGGGACIAAPGARGVASAAKYYTVPVLALAPLYKLLPLHATDPQYTELTSPLLTHDYRYSDTAVSHVYSPLYDFLEPDLVTLFITNLGGSSPSYIYRLISEIYDPKDSELTS